MNKKDWTLFIEKILIQQELNTLSHFEISNLNIKESIERTNPKIQDKSKK